MSSASATAATTVQATEAAYVLQTYRRQPVVFVRGEGVWLVADDGTRYLDMLSGIGVNVLGHTHPALVAAVREQVGELVHTSNLFFHPYQGVVAERLAKASGLARAFFCNSGTEAVEGCLKFARRYWYTAGTPRPQFIAFERGFSGRTMGALSTTWDEHYRTPFEPLVPEVRFVSNEDPADLLAAVSDRTAAIIAEPIQGEGGVRPLPPQIVAAINTACEQTGALYIADEVQSGLGRTGQMFHSRTLGLSPDLISVGKALGAGVPVGAVLVSSRVANAISAGDHGTTYGGNLLACRAALAVLDALEGGLLDHVRRMGPIFADALRSLADRHPSVVGVRGAGLIQGLVLDRDAAPVVPAALERGLIVNRTAERVVRLLPPYVITEAEIAEAISRLDAALTAVEGA
ncbi:MAG: acetylornithine/succinylornithine family transaminase [Acidobacteria bacterium]|nr:acetylornithine/succinylornithine family transaminase [Acidobacteriota bacterium]